MDQACEVCGNDYDRPLRVTLDGKAHVYDCFECAIHALAPICEHCGCRIIGHGAQVEGRFYCSGHCAHAEGNQAIVDHV